MFQLRLLNLVYIDKEVSSGYFPLPISYSSAYQIRCEVIVGENKGAIAPHIEGEIKVTVGSFKPKPNVIFKHQLIRNFVESFRYNLSNIKNDGVSALLTYECLNVNFSYIILFEICEINTKIIESLNTSQETKDKILEINYKFLLKQYKDALLRIGNLGEAIAKELMRKLKKPWKDFKGSINVLTKSDVPKPRSKINYQMLGNFLAPLYYIRNQTHHSVPKIEINESIAAFAIKNLSVIIEHIHDKNIKF